MRGGCFCLRYVMYSQGIRELVRGKIFFIYFTSFFAGHRFAQNELDDLLPMYLIISRTVRQIFSI